MMAPTLYGTLAFRTPEALQKPRRPWALIAASTVLASVLVALAVHARITESHHYEARAHVSRSGKYSRAGERSSQRPHILLVTLDDVGWNDFGPSSSDLSELTPHMNELSEAGVRLTNYYGQSLCTPARAALHTGKFTHRTGFSSFTMEREINALSNYSLPIANRLLAQRLRDDAGYATLFVGKWNVGHCAEAYTPWNRGFDRFLGYFSSGIDYISCVVAVGFVVMRAPRPLAPQVSRDASARLQPW